MFKILVVEDDRDLNRTVCTFLNQSGYETTGCLNAADACDAMYDTVFDLIVSDIMMPDVDGFEFVKNVRTVNDNIPILFMTVETTLPPSRRATASASTIIWSSPSIWMSCSCGSEHCSVVRKSHLPAVWKWGASSWMRMSIRHIWTTKKFR